MQSRTILVLFLAVICATAAALGVNQLLQQMEARSKLDTTTVVVATRDVPRGGVLTEDAVSLREWPSKLVPAGVITDIAKVKDKTAAVPIVKDEPLLGGKIVDGLAHASLAGLIPRGMRAFTISIPHNASGVGGFIVPGNNVDVLLTTTSQGMDSSGGAVTTTLLQNIQILAVDQFLDTPDEKEVSQRDVKSVTLLVSPDQAAKLSLAANKGTLNLSLRHPDDQGEAGAQPMTMNELRLYQGSSQPSRVAAVAERVFAGVVAAMAQAQSASATPQPPTPAPAAEAPAAPTQKTAVVQTLRGTQSGVVQVRK